MSKNSIILAVMALFLIASIAFSYISKKEFKKELTNIEQQKEEITKVIKLKELWGAKGIKSKIEKIINPIPANKRKNFLAKSSKAEIKLVALSDKELNRVLSKLAMLPIEFKRLNITKSGDNFNLECLCVW